MHMFCIAFMKIFSKPLYICYTGYNSLVFHMFTLSRNDLVSVVEFYSPEMLTDIFIAEDQLSSNVFQKQFGSLGWLPLKYYYSYPSFNDSFPIAVDLCISPSQLTGKWRANLNTKRITQQNRGLEIAMRFIRCGTNAQTCCVTITPCITAVTTSKYLVLSQNSITLLYKYKSNKYEFKHTVGEIYIVQ